MSDDPMVVRLVPKAEPHHHADRADRMLATLIILMNGGGRITAGLWKVAVNVLAAVGLISLIGR